MKLKPTHTPGPWQFYQPSEFPKDWRIAQAGGVIRDGNPRGGYVCRLTSSHENGPGSQPPLEADARLMAAAPDLLDACREMDNELMYLAQRGLARQKPDLFIIDRMRKAIAKATGK